MAAHSHVLFCTKAPTHHLGGKSLNLRNLQKKTGRNLLKKSCYEECDPAGVNLTDYPQWREEEGYWIGEYTFYKSDGTPFTSATWNYRYDAYRGFITGGVKGCVRALFICFIF